MFASPRLCLLAGILPGLVIDALAPVTASLVGGRMPVQTDIPWLSIVPIAESRSSYNGLLVFLFIALSASLAAAASPPLRLARAAARRRPGIAAFPIRARRRNTAPAASRSRSAASSARSCSHAREHVTMPPPGDARAGHVRTSSCTICIWDCDLRADRPAPCATPPTASTSCSSCTIRQYLSLVFVALVLLLLVLAIWL